MISSPYRGFALMEGNGEGLFFCFPGTPCGTDFADGGAAVEAALLKAAGKVEGVIHKHLQNY